MLKIFYVFKLFYKNHKTIFKNYFSKTVYQISPFFFFFEMHFLCVFFIEISKLFKKIIIKHSISVTNESGCVDEKSK